jgi:hypothetical protein
VNARRRFPPPWSVEDIASSFGGGGQKLAGVYYEAVTKPLSKDEAADDFSVWRVASWVSVRGYLRRSGPGIQSAKAAITGDHVRAALIYRVILAIPVHISAEGYYSAPWGIARSLAGYRSQPRRRHKGGDTDCHFREGFRHDRPSLFRVSS